MDQLIIQDKLERAKKKAEALELEYDLPELMEIVNLLDSAIVEMDTISFDDINLDEF